jgi:hypothetical protein
LAFNVNYMPATPDADGLKPTDECLDKFYKATKEPDSKDWDKHFKEYIKCKYEMFSTLKEKERRKDDWLQFSVIFLGTLVIFINALPFPDNVKAIVSATSGFLISLSVAFNKIKKYQERWPIFKGVSRALEFEYIDLTKPEESFRGERESKAYQNMLEILKQEAREVISLSKENTKPENTPADPKPNPNTGINPNS